MGQPAVDSRPSPERADSISVAILGSGGDGVITAGNLLLEAAGSAGWYGIMTRSNGPQIRGGEGAAMLRLARRPVSAHAGRFDACVAIGWNNAHRFLGEIELDAGSLVIGDSGTDIPAPFIDTGATTRQLALAAAAAEVENGRPNMVVLGLLAALIGLPLEVVTGVLDKTLGRKGATAVAAAAQAVARGYDTAHEAGIAAPATAAKGEFPTRWSITGNEAAGLGAMRGGVRFVAAYPITPATEVLEWLAPALARAGGVLVQAEDELASVNQLLGASFGGVPSLTATSGPGLSLMVESLGLAIASETPLVVIDVMRGGPSTGIPTKSEQSDLNIALYGLHGDAPHLVLAPQSISDCVFTTQWAVHLAEKLQTVAIVLSDQSLGQTRAIIDRPADVDLATGVRRIADAASDYRRYADSDDGVSPMSLPGTPGCQYTADGLSHAVTGTPSSRPEDHHLQLEKRRRKLEEHDYGEAWADIEGDGDTAVITWGSSSAPVREALASLAGSVRLVVPRLLLPVQPAAMARALAGVKRILVVEQSHGAQFHRYLRAYYDLPGEVRSLARPGPLQFRPDEISDALDHWSAES